jgi:hypothetical protein
MKLLQLKLSFKCFVLLFALLIVNDATVVIAKPSAFQGRRFLVAFMQNEIQKSTIAETAHFSIFISTTQRDTVTIIMPNANPIDTILTARAIHEIKVSLNLEVKVVGIHNDKTIEIRSKHPITCWVYSSREQSSDSYVAFPVNTWGEEYRIISMPNDAYSGKERLIADRATDENGNIIDAPKYAEMTTPRSGQFLVIATLDNTTVTYTPTCNTKNGVSRGQTATVTLNKNEALLVQAAGGGIGTEDLTGTLVRSNNPIGVLSGHVRTSLEQGLDHPYDTKDHLAEMLLPTKAWGKKFITVPFVDGQRAINNSFFTLCVAGDLIRVIAKEDNTTLKYSIHQPNNSFDVRQTVISKAGDFFEFETNVPVIWEANKPVQVAQFMMRKGTEGETFDYDPTLVVIAPVEQYIDEVTFATPSNSNVLNQYRAHCIILITDSIGIYNMFFNGNRIQGGNNTPVWNQRIGNSEYYWAMRTLTPGGHRIHSERNSKFSGIIYGHGYRDSYGHTLGSRLNDPYNVDTIPPVITSIDSCGVLRIRITDTKNNDANATGIDWVYIRKNNNYTVEKFEVSDTATVVDIIAEPTDYTQNGLLEIEVFDKELNSTKREFNYHGFKINYPQNYDFQMLSWNNPTQESLPIRNAGSGNQRLVAITQSTDSRLVATTNPTLPSTLTPNQTIALILTFTPDETVELLDTEITLIFECHSVKMSVFGNIAAPGLIARNLDFGKVRLFDSKTLSDRILNAGNIAIDISSLEKDIIEPVFFLFLSQNFPTQLAIGDSINYTVEFVPTEIKNYKVISQVINNEAPCSFFVSGEGAAPNIENITLDWGRRRLGTVNDTVIHIVNSGNFDDTVSYKTVLSLSHSEDFSVDTLQKISDIIILENQNVPLNFSFIPQDILPMENIVELVSAWKNHTPILATVKAQGTIPVIETANYNFGTHTINSQITHNHAIIKSLGNEALTIDSIVFLSGDSSSFLINYLQLQNFLVEPNTQFSCFITFQPKFSGEHKILLEITHDANPNYARSKDTVEISGYCITENLDLLLDLTMPEIYSCQTVDANVSLKNTGLASITVDSILLKCEPNIFSATFTDDISQIFPTELHENETLNLPLKIYAERNKNGILEASAFYNSENEINIQKPVSPITSNIKTNLNISTNSITPGDTVYIFCKAEITQKSEKEFNFAIRLNLNRKNFAVLEKKCYIEFFTSENNSILEATITQFENYIEFEIPISDIKIDNATVIGFEIKLLTLLAPQKEVQFSFEVISERCYNSEIAILDVRVNPICADDFRQLNFDGFPYLMIKQNPTENNIDFAINIIEDDLVSIMLMDLLGNVVYEKSDLVLGKGKHNFTIDTYSVVSAEYFLTVNSNQFSTTKKVIVSR